SAGIGVRSLAIGRGSRAEGQGDRRWLSLFDLIRRMSRANRLWGAPRIHGELGGNRSGAIDCREVSAADEQTTLGNVGNVPHESYGADGFDGLLHGADGHLSGAIRFPGVVARSATHTALEHNGTPDGGVDRATTSRSFSLG